MDDLLARGHEVTGVEFKPPGPRTDRLLQCKVIRSALGMSNRRDGGRVIIGVTESGSTVQASGLSDAELRTWKHDHIATMFSSYADPSIVFETDIVDCHGQKLVVLHVREFSDVPLLCKKELGYHGTQELRPGACYVRSLRKPETAEVSTQEDMRDLLDLALDKALSKWLGQAQRAGMHLPSMPPQPSDARQYEEESTGL